MSDDIPDQNPTDHHDYFSHDPWMNRAMDSSHWRTTAEQQYIENMNQQTATALFYGDTGKKFSWYGRLWDKFMAWVRA